MNKTKECNYLSLTHFFSKALFLGIGVSKVLLTARENTIFSLILGSILGSIILYFISKFNYIKSNGFRKLVMFIVIFILFIIGIDELVNLITSIYLIDSNNFFVMLPLLLVIVYMNSKDISVNLKIANMLLYIFDGMVLLSFISLIPEIDVMNYLPLFKVSIKDTLLASLEFALFSTVPNILYGGIEIDFKSRNISKNIIKRYLLSNLFISIIIITTQGVFGIELVELFKFPEYVVLKKISLLDFINNIENILSFCLIFVVYIYLSICSKELYDMCYKEFGNRYVYIIFLIVSLYFISKYVFDNINFFIIISKYLWLILLGILVIYIIVNIKSFKKEKK